MNLPIRNSVKVILLNEKNELLLMCADDPKTTSASGKYHGKFWFLVGGEIKVGESIEEAALREIYEETGISRKDINIGPIVWYGEYNLNLSGILTHINQKFIVAKTKQNTVSFEHMTPEEHLIIQAMEWFSLKKIKDSTQIIYPALLSRYLPDIIDGKYPDEPIEINLAKQPYRQKFED